MNNELLTQISEKIKNLTSFLKSQTNDSINNRLPTDEEEIDSQIKKSILEENGVDRVKDLFTVNDQGEYHEFLNENLQILTSVSVSGFILGSILEMNKSSEKFKRNSQITVYSDKKAASRAFIDYVYLQTIKGGTKLSLKFGLFSGIILGSSMLIQSYRNKTTPFDYSIGGAISGGIFRLHHGLLNFMIGTAVGGIFGTMFGLVRYAQMKMMNMTYEDRRYNEKREQIIKANVLKLFSHENKEKNDI